MRVALQQALRQREVFVQRAAEEMQYYKLELQNREENYNQLFGDKAVNKANGMGKPGPKGGANGGMNGGGANGGGGPMPLSSSSVCREPHRPIELVLFVMWSVPEVFMESFYPHTKLALADILKLER